MTFNSWGPVEVDRVPVWCLSGLFAAKPRHRVWKAKKATRDKGRATFLPDLECRPWTVPQKNGEAAPPSAGATPVDERPAVPVARQNPPAAPSLPAAVASRPVLPDRALFR